MTEGCQGRRRQAQPRSRQDAPAVEEKATDFEAVFRFADEAELREAVNNFRTYLEILQEWARAEEEDGRTVDT